MRRMKTAPAYAALFAAMALLFVASRVPLQASLYPALSYRYAVGDPLAENPLSWTEGPKSLAAGDLNGDGQADIVVGSLDGSISVLLADGAEGLQDQILVPATGLLQRSSIRAVAVADFDLDGSPDVAAADIAQGGVVVLSGAGDGTLLPLGRTDLGWARALSASDVNGDGAPDLLVGCGIPDCDRREGDDCEGGTFLLLGGGDGTFLAPRKLGGGPEDCPDRCIYDVALTDIDRDGEIDALSLDFDQGELLVYAGEGGGNFRLKNALPTQGGGARAFVVAFIDERLVDGAPPPGATLDIAVANRRSATLDVFLGRGGGDFSSGISVPSGDAPRDVAAADLDGDDLADLVVVNRNAHMVSVFRGLGDARFSDLPFETPTGTSPRQIVLADVTGDGNLDAAVVNRISGDLSLLPGRSGLAGFVVSECHYPGGITPVGVVADDFDGDGLPDVATVNMRSHDLRVRLNVGGGQLGPETVYGVNYGPASLAGGDINGDGHSDLVVTCLGSQAVSAASHEASLVTLLGHGDGTFADPQTTSGAGFQPYWLQLGDLSGDGKLDAAVGGLRGEIVLYRGRGDGRFDAGVSLDLPTGRSGTPLTIDLADVSSDGHLDIVTSGGVILVNDGDLFSPGASVPVKRFPVDRGDWVVESADLDRDGILDLIVALTFVEPDPIAVHFGTGGGSFLKPVIYPTGMGVTAISATDMDGDGRMDIVTGNRCTADVSIMRGLGGRDFELLETVKVFPVEGLAVTDMTGDGRPDLVGVGVGLWVVPQGGACPLSDPRDSNPSGLPRREGVYINELMSFNETFHVDALGKTPDWVEIYNHTDAPVNLSDWTLRERTRDGEINSWKFPVGQAVGAYDYVVVFCSQGAEVDGELYAPFSLNRRGEGLSLLDATGAEVDRIDFPPMPRNVSYARFVDGARFLCYNPVPTMGASNVRSANLDPSVDPENPFIAARGRRVGVTARTFDDTGLAYASVLYRLPGQPNFGEALLSDDGLHGDGAAGDGLFGALLPEFPPGSTVLYYLRIVDLEGEVALAPGEPTREEDLLRVVSPPSAPGLSISEALPDNETGITDERGKHEDWVEIQNCGDVPVSLENVALTKDYNDGKQAWLFPPGRILEPRQRLVVFCDNDQDEGPLHASFRLDKDGDQVLLVEAETWTLLDSLSFGALPDDTSFGRVACGEDPQVLARPTPGGPNAGAGDLFVRGDTNADGLTDISDPVNTLVFLFLGEPGTMDCPKSADTNDSGDLNITDPIALLGYLFLGGLPPVEPSGDCGLDRTPDELTCDSYSPCE